MRRLQLWSTHKWLCGKPTSIFTFAPLDAEERDTTLDMIRLPDARRWKALSEVEISEADGWREGNYEVRVPFLARAARGPPPRASDRRRAPLE